jgi:hypothetical protein
LMAIKALSEHPCALFYVVVTIRPGVFRFILVRTVRFAVAILTALRGASQLADG